MSKPFIRAPLPSDYAILGETMQEADKREARITPSYQDSNDDYGYVLRASDLQSMYCKVIDLGGQPIGMYGVAAYGNNWAQSEIGSPWFCSSKELAKIGQTFLRHAPQEVENMHKYFRCLFNYIAKENLGHVKWLEWLGFQVSKNPVPGPDNSTLYPFVRVR